MAISERVKEALASNYRSQYTLSPQQIFPVSD
jgi:hypothetical protein